MISPKLFATSLRIGTAALLSATALSACSTLSSISPFGSNVPYSQDIQPTVPRPAQPEIPAFKAAPKPPPKTPQVDVSEQPTPAPSTPAPSTPPAAAPTPAPAPSAPPPASEPAPAAPPSPPPAPQSAAPEAAPAPKVAAATAPAATENPAPAEAQSGGDANTENLPQLPAEHREFKDDGSYPNLAQVPARPVNLPTFAEAKKVEKALLADNEKQKAAPPDSPAAPSVDSAPEKVAVAAPVPAVPEAIAAGLPRPEDKSPCLSTSPVSGNPTATVRFAAGSSSITSDDLQVLAEAMPTIRGAKGSVRVFGHGDTDATAPQGSGRFELAAARAGAVAQALAGFGIPAPKIAVGVACRDAATNGASVQLYAES